MTQPTQELIEGIVTRLRDYIRDNIESKVRALNAIYKDDVKLKAPSERTSYYLGPRALLDGPDYPRVFVVGNDTGILTYDSNQTDASHRVAISVGVKGETTTVVQLQMYRFGRALWELMVERFFATTPDDYFALHGSGDITLRYEPGASSEANTPPYFGLVTLEATFEKDERW